MEIIFKKKPPKTTEVFDTYWKFASLRQNIFYKRLYGDSPRSTDPILKRYKFTNAYRASDRVSQYLIGEVIYNSRIYSPEDILFRILLFKTFNKIETWQALERQFGDITYKDFDFDRYESFLTCRMLEGKSIYSGAYIMASGKSYFGFKRKHQNHLRLLSYMMEDSLLKKVENALSMSQVFEELTKYPTIGKFLAYQYTIDINYSPLTNFSEMDFVVPGPGALDGQRKCFSDLGDYNTQSIIHYMAENQNKEFERLEISFQSLWGRDLQLIDCQNLFCEVDKYARVAHPDYPGLSGRKRIKQKFLPKSKPVNYFYPPKWNINQKIAYEYEKAETK